MTTLSMPLPMIDCHCHILPGVDDGSQTVEESLEMAKIAAHDGIEKIIATPHVTDAGPSPEVIATRVNEFNLLLQEKNIPVQVFPGAEAASGLTPVLFSRHTLNRTSYVLIEFPHDHLPSFAKNILQWLITKGLRPIIAHPERNYSIIRSPETLLNILSKDIHVQITGASILGDYGRDIQLCAYFLMDSGNVDIIASDAHGEKIRPPMLSAARDAAARRLGKKAADRLVIANPAAVLSGEAMGIG